MALKKASLEDVFLELTEGGDAEEETEENRNVEEEMEESSDAAMEAEEREVDDEWPQY